MVKWCEIQRGYRALTVSLGQDRSRAKGLWRVTADDALCMICILVMTLLVWGAAALLGPFGSVTAYWDGPNYMYAGATLYNIPPNNPWTRNFHYPPSYFACHLPGYPLLIRVCSHVCFGSYKYGMLLSILVGDCLFVYSFRRMLIVYDAVSNPTFTTILSAIIPFRFIIYHSVGASETLFMTYVSLSLIFYKIDRYFPMVLCVWGGCITRIEGMAIGASIGLCFLLQFKIIKAIGMFSTFIAPLSLVFLHYYRFGDALAYLHFNQSSQKLISWPPFHEFTQIPFSNDEAYIYSFTGFYVIIMIGVSFLYSVSLPLAIVATIFLAYVAVLFHIDIYRYCLPASILGVLVGFDGFFSSKPGKFSLIWASPFLLLVLITYAGKQIHSNRAWDQFMDQVYASIRESK